MNRRIVYVCLLLAALTGGWKLHAQPLAGNCLIGPGIGSTLLFPYFEVDLANENGANTVLSVNNATSSPVLTRVTVWTDWGVPTAAFDVYLSAFDIQTLNMRLLFSGNVPSTGAGVDLSAFPFCDTSPPNHSNPVFTSDVAAQLRADHQGLQGPLVASCAGEPVGDGLARGYVTVDVVDECSGTEGFAPVFTPANVDWPYFADGGASNGIAIISNSIWGDLTYVNFDEDSAQASEAIVLWADPAQFSGTGIYTFYGRFSGFDGRDDRVPLPNLWNQRFFNGGPFAGGADLIVWQDTNLPPEIPACGDRPSWHPLNTVIGAFDENGVVLARGGGGVIVGGDPLPVATQRTSVSDFSLPFAFGYTQVFSPASQSWVMSTLKAGGRFSATGNGFPAGFLCDATPPQGPPPPPPLNAPTLRRSSTVSSKQR